MLQREVLQVVFAQNADRVDEAFEDVLERAAVTADLREHLEAIERALALSNRLEVIGRLLEQAYAGHGRLAELGRVLALPGASREVEPHEGGDVHALAVDAGRARRGDLAARCKARPEGARGRPVARRLSIERGARHHPGLFGLARGLDGEALGAESPRAVAGRDRRQDRLRAAPRRWVVRRERLDHRQRPARVAGLREHVHQRTKHGVVVAVRRVGLRRGR